MGIFFIENCVGNNCSTNGILKRGKYLESKTGIYRLKLQENGNLEIFCQNVSVWETKTINNNVDFLYFDSNGNLVLFGKDKSIIWAAGIGLDATKLIMQDDGNLVLYKDDNQSVWSTDTNNKCHSDKGLKLFPFLLFLIKAYCYTLLGGGFRLAGQDPSPPHLFLPITCLLEITCKQVTSVLPLHPENLQYHPKKRL